MHVMMLFSQFLLPALMTLAMPGALALAGPDAAFLPLVRDGSAAFRVVVVKLPDGEWLLDRAAETIKQTIARWAQVDVPVVTRSQSDAAEPEGGEIVLGTTQGLRALGDSIPEIRDAIARASAMDEHGFVCLPHGESDNAVMFVISRSPRGVFNGANYLREFCIDGPADRLRLRLEAHVRSPRMAGRAVYLLTIWGDEARYTADDWISVFDSFARDGFDRIYFWFSGHFPSKKYPQTYRCADGSYDSTVHSGIPTIEEHRRIIRAAHERGLRIYLGGALGGWVGTRFLTNAAPGTMKTPPSGAQYEGKYSLCPSSPASRRALIEYYKEMFDALHDADGVFIESADEWGGCVCERCGQVIDAQGSTHFGQAQLTLVQQIMATIWADHPQARLSYTIGYPEHRRDPAYYQVIAQMNDPRVEWMEARNSWAFPDVDGQARPARCFSRRVMRWQQYYSLPLETLVRDANRVGHDGLYGLITAFEPGAGTGDFYKDIPYPIDILPYVLTGFAWREMTWDPDLTRERLLERIHARFLGPSAPSQLAEDLSTLREIFRACASGKLLTADHDKLAPIEARIAAARSGATPKALQALDLMTRAIRDIRQRTTPSSQPR